jgi:hypothetical protein
MVLDLGCVAALAKIALGKLKPEVEVLASERHTRTFATGGPLGVFADWLGTA